MRIPRSAHFQHTIQQIIFLKRQRLQFQVQTISSSLY